MDKIRFISREDINVKAWDEAVLKSNTGLPYAYCWYLDAMAGPNWSALVLGDYEKVMPLPWNRKLLGWKQLYQPAFCQQLGVFGEKVDYMDLATFLVTIPKAFRYVHLNLHAYEAMAFAKNIPGTWRRKINLILPLDQPYETLQMGFSKSLRKRIRKAEQQLYLKKEGSPEALIDFYRKELKGKVHLPDETYQKLPILFHGLLDRQMADIYQVCNEYDQPVSMGIFPKTEKRIINLFGASNAKGRAAYAMHFLLAKVMEEHCESNLLFDFEGSEVPGVAEFFRSYGPTEQAFIEFKRDNLPGLIRYIQRIRHRY